MFFTLFYHHFPELAKRETRNIIVMPGHPSGLPGDEYSLLELYCDEPGCDCRRVMFLVVSTRSKDPLAVIAYGWEPEDFYRKWLKIDDDNLVKDMRGPSLNLGSPQSKYAQTILALVANVVLADEAYIERIKRHYQMMRDKINSEHPKAAQKGKGLLKKKPPTGKKKRKKRGR